MEDYYIVYDATPAEQGENFVQMGIARSVDQFPFEEGAETNIFTEIEIDNPVPDGAIIPKPQTEDEGEIRNRIAVLIIAVISGLCVASGLIYCLKKKNQPVDEEKLIDTIPKDRMGSVMSDISMETPMNVG